MSTACSGTLVVIKREDGSGIMRADIAIGKAWGRSAWAFQARTIRIACATGLPFRARWPRPPTGALSRFPAAVLMLNASQEVTGAVGVCGDASNKDEYAAITAVQRARLTPHPAAPAENWRDACL